MSNDIILPNALRYPVLREDVQVIDHISLLLSEESIRLLSSLLRDKGIENDFIYTRHNKEHIREIGITVAYSENRIQCYPFSYHDVELETHYKPLAKKIKLKVKDLIPYCFTSIKGEEIECLKIEKDETFNRMHEFFIRECQAVWNQGEYFAFIKVKHPNEKKQFEYLSKLNLQDNQEELILDTMRYMRFGEVIKTEQG